MHKRKIDATTIRELKLLSDSSHKVISKLTESIKLLAVTRTDSPNFDSAMKKVRNANLEADELLSKQQQMISSLK